MSQALPSVSKQDSFSIPSPADSEWDVACPACKKYGRVSHCISQELRPAMYLDLAATLFNPGQVKIYTSHTSSEKQLLWHANLIGKNPEFIQQIIKNLLKYVFHHTPEEYSEDIMALLSRKTLHVPRELRFIRDIIRDLQDNRFDSVLVNLLREFNGDSKNLFSICSKDSRFTRLLPLLSLIFLEKRTDGKGFYISQVKAPLCPSRDISFNISLNRTPSPQTQPEPLECHSQNDSSSNTFSLQKLELESDASSQSNSSFFSHSSSQKSENTIRGSDLCSFYDYDDDFDVPAVVDKQP